MNPFARLVPAVMAPAMITIASAGPRFYAPDPTNLPAYRLPDPLKAADGSAVTAADGWMKSRRAEVLELFRSQVFGRVPPAAAAPGAVRAEVVELNAAVLDGTATLKRVRFTAAHGGKSLVFTASLLLPNHAPKPVPAFLLICNRGATNIDPTRAVRSDFWPAEEILGRGYATAAYQVGEIDPDTKDGYADGVRALFDGGAQAPDAWATLSAWAWGASRILDFLETDPGIAKGKVAVIGHSRGGKTALWAAAQDERFGLACVNNSGCGGANILRRRFEGRESVARINKNFPHWFNANFKKYDNREDDLPVDHHMLIALVAPRWVHVASAEGDLWADPRGEFLGCVHAAPVYELLGGTGLGSAEMPAIGAPLRGDGMAYHIREGKHNLTLEDWRAYLDTADKAFGRAPGTR